MRILFDPNGWEDFCYWLETDPKVFSKLLGLINEARRTPFSGTGKPEPLKGDWQGFWSRRISGEHRLVYRVSGSGDNKTLEIAVCRFHYSKR